MLKQIYEYVWMQNFVAHRKHKAKNKSMNENENRKEDITKKNVDTWEPCGHIVDVKNKHEYVAASCQIR